MPVAIISWQITGDEKSDCLQASPGTYHEGQKGRNQGLQALLGYSTGGKGEGVSVSFPSAGLVGLAVGF